MRQEVNLYLPGLRKQRDYLTASTTTAGLGVLLVLLLAVGLYQYWQGQTLISKIADHKHRNAALSRQIAQLKQSLPRSRAAELDAEIAELRQLVEHRKSINELIGGRSMGNTIGFSEQMNSLARSVNGDLSLSGFGFINGGQRVALQGQVALAQSVPHYVEKLQSEESFRDSNFGRLRVVREGESPLLKFSLNRDDSDG